MMWISYDEYSEPGTHSPNFLGGALRNEDVFSCFCFFITNQTYPKNTILILRPDPGSVAPILPRPDAGSVAPILPRPDAGSFAPKPFTN